jgi:hypothetical protein
MSGDKRWLFSFENICQIVDMNPDYLRQGLNRWRMESGRVAGIDVVGAMVASEASPGH